MDYLNEKPEKELTTQQKLNHAARSSRKKLIITVGIALVLKFRCLDLEIY